MKHISRGRLVAIGATLAVTAMALVPGAWGTAVAQTTPAPTGTATPTATSTPVITIITNPGGATQASTTVTGTGTGTVGDGTRDGGAQVSIPAGSMPAGSTVTVAQPPSFANLVRVDSKTAAVTIPVLMSLTATAPDGSAITEFDEPVTVRVNVPDSLWAQVQRLAGSSPAVFVQNVNPTTGKITTIACTLVDAARGIVDCSLPHFSDWALIVEFEVEEGTDPGAIAAGLSDFVPTPANTGIAAADGTSRSTTMWMLAGLSAVALAAGGGALAYRRMR